MKIISKYKDYYDSIVNTVGIDNAIVFKRDQLDEKEITLDNLYTPLKIDDSNKTPQNNNESISYHFKLLGYCGSIYPCLQIKKSYYESYNNTEEFIYDVDIIKETYFKLYNQKDKYIAFNHNWNNYISQTNNKKLLSIFLDKKVISFVIFKHGLTGWYRDSKTVCCISYNPILKNYHFFKVKDAFTAFNEISIFVAEQLNTEISEFNMTDKQLVVSKGFDPIYGFRKRK